jgi:hypothetical protein
MDKTRIEDKTLSLKAKGLLTYFYSMPEDWHFSYNDLVSISTDGIKSIKTTIKELKAAGYLVSS